jgi:hypothetical protein
LLNVALFKYFAFNTEGIGRRLGMPFPSCRFQAQKPDNGLSAHPDRYFLSAAELPGFPVVNGVSPFRRLFLA